MRLACRRTCAAVVSGLVMIERTPAAVNASPNTPVTSAGYPVFVSGTRLYSETVSTFVNARRDAAARTSRITAG